MFCRTDFLLRYMIVATSDDNNDEFSYFYCLFTAVGLSEGSSETVLRTATKDDDINTY